MSLPDAAEVLVIGAGPVGLGAAFQLGRAGVRTLVVERRDTLSRHPKALGIHARTMEIFRQWGVADEIRAAGGGIDTVSISWKTRFAGIDLGELEVGADPAEREQFAAYSPEPFCGCGQDLYEPILARAACAHPSVTLQLGIEATALRQDSRAATVTVRDAAGSMKEIRADYVLAADGVRSPTRDWLGIPEAVEPAFGRSINVRFRAPLEPYRSRRHLLLWVINAETQGAFVWQGRGDEWTYNFEAAPDRAIEYYDEARCAAILRAAIGVADVPIAIHSIVDWRHEQAVADRWRVGRVFIAGDAAHRFPPHGGFGMNSGVQDSVNLAWKLIAALRWRAGDALLDTYELERRPVAQFNAEQCIVNTRRMAETGWLLPDPAALAAIERPEGAQLRAGISAAIPRQREQFFSHGQQFGTIYQSSAVIDDGTTATESSVAEYRPTAHPGARAPHAWLLDSAERPLSTIDLYDGAFVLFAGPHGEAWRAAGEQAARELSVPMHVHVIGGGELKERRGDPRWSERTEVDESGAILVRPDGHVAFRSRTLPAAPEQALTDALQRILSR
jgi:putative polyketide hydroxylase